MLIKPANWSEHAWERFHERYDLRHFKQKYLYELYGLIEYNFRSIFRNTYFSEKEDKVVAIKVKLRYCPKLRILYNYKQHCVITCLPKDVKIRGITTVILSDKPIK